MRVKVRQNGRGPRVVRHVDDIEALDFDIIVISNENGRVRFLLKVGLRAALVSSFQNVMKNSVEFGPQLRGG